MGLSVLIKQFPSFASWKLIDLYRYIKNREWNIFKGFGMHVYVGMFGSGKTSSMVNDVYEICCKYKSVQILTNMTLFNFPKWTKIIVLTDYKQIVSAPANTIILIDEISSIFNSRNWKEGGIHPDLLKTILQVRKESKMLLCTAQRFMHMDALFRQITFTVRDCFCFMGRWNFVSVFDGWDYENKAANQMLEPIKSYSFVQGDDIRHLYNTNEIIESFKKTDFVDEEEILSKQAFSGNIGVNINTEENKPKIKDRIKSSIKKTSNRKGLPF